MIIIRYQSFPANAVRTHRFESVAPSSPRKSDGNCGLVKVERFASPLSASFTSRLLRPRGTFAGVVNFCRYLTGWSFRSLHHLRQEPGSVFAVSFRPGPFVAIAHKKQRNERSLSWVTRNMLRVTKCL
jgi:hypothetical protein